MHSFRYNLKKAVASKVVESQLGRKIIQQNVGEEGNHFVDAIKSAASKFSDRSTAKQHKHTLYKMVLKTKLMVDQELVDTDDGKQITDRWNDVYPHLSCVLRGKTQSTKDLEPVMEELKKTVVGVIGEHMQEKNKILLTEAIEFFTSEKFITAVATDPTYREERDIMLENIETINATLINPITMEKQVQRVSIALFNDKYSTIVDAVQTFWRKVMRKEMDVGKAIYENLFEMNPEFQTLFHMEPEKQQTLFMKMLNNSFAGLSEFERLREQLQHLGEMHVEKGVPYVAYAKMWLAFEKTMKQLFPKEYTKMVQKSCKLIFNHLADVIRSCYPPEDVNDSKEDQHKEMNFHPSQDQLKQPLLSFWNYVKDDQEMVGRTMYEYLFEEHPEYENLFSGDFGEQQRMFTMITKLLTRIINNLDDCDKMNRELILLGRLHTGLDVPSGSYLHMWSALDLALTLIFDISYTPRIRSSLRMVFMNVVNIFEIDGQMNCS